MPSTPPETAVLHQVERMFTVPPFSNSTLLRRFLRFALEETLAERGRDLTQSSIGYQVFGFGADFDPETNAVVRVNANRLRRALEKYYRESGQTEPVLIGMPPGGYSLSISYGTRSSTKARPSLPAPLVALVEFKGIGLMKPWEQFPLLLVEKFSASISRMPQLRLLGPFRRAEWDGGIRHLAESPGGQPLDFIIDGCVNQAGKELLIHTRLLEGGTGLGIWSGLHRCSLEAPNLAEAEAALMRRIGAEVLEEFGLAECRANPPIGPKDLSA